MFIYETRDIFAKEGEQEAKSYKGVVFCSNDNQLPAEVGQEILIVPADNPVSVVATVEEKPGEEGESVNFYKMTVVDDAPVFEKLENGAKGPAFKIQSLSELSEFMIDVDGAHYGVIDSNVAVSAETSSGHTLTCSIETVGGFDEHYAILFSAEGVDDSWFEKTDGLTKITTVTVTAGNSTFIFDIEYTSK